MKFKTRLRVTFIIIIVVPLALIACAFCIIGLYLMNAQKGLPMERMDYGYMSDGSSTVIIK